MENHKFDQSTFSSLCKVCYRPKIDSYHRAFLDAADMKPNEKMPTVNQDHELSSTQETITLVEGESRFINGVNETNVPDCYGHRCPNCDTVFYHTFKCWPDPKFKEVMHCEACFGNASVIINRESHLKQIVSDSSFLTPPDVLKAIEIEHESFVVLEAVKDPNVDFREWCGRHIADIRMKMEKLATQEKSTRKALVALEKEEQSKLTPQEIEDYERRAKRQKKINISDAQEDKLKEWTKQLKALSQLMGNEAIARIQLENLYKLQGKEVPK